MLRHILLIVGVFYAVIRQPSRGIGPCRHQRRGVTRDRDIRDKTAHITGPLNYQLCENAKALA